MRVLVPLCLVLAPPSLAAAPTLEPARVPEGGLSLPRPAGLPDRLYAGDIYTSSVPGGSLFIMEGADPDRPARWMRLDDDGTIAWQADHRCPTFTDFAVVLGPDDAKAPAPRAVCKAGAILVGVDAVTGAEVWSFADPRPLYMTVRAGGRVAVSIDNQEVAVVEAADGQEVMRLDVDGAVLEAAAVGPRGPLAFLVQDSPASDRRTVDLPVGRDDTPTPVSVAGDDPGRQLVAVAIGGRAPRGLVRPEVVWSTPFEGWSFDLEPARGVLLGEPTDGRVVAYALSDGHVVWERREVAGELRAWSGDDGIVVYRAGAALRVAALDPRSGATRWQHDIPTDAEPIAVGAGQGDVGVLWAGGAAAFTSEGRVVRWQATLLDGEALLGVVTNPRAAAWVVASGDTRALFFRATR